MPNIFSSPHLFLSRFAALPGTILGLGEAQFISIDDSELQQLAFLDQRELDRPVTLSLTLDDFTRQVELAAPQHAFGMIYHSAFCCSTFLARCLDATGIARSLKEPYALTQLSFYEADETLDQFDGSEAWERLLRSAVNFLSRPQQRKTLPVIKSHNFSIVLAPTLSRLFAGRARSLYIYSDLGSFLASVLKSHERREFVRMLLKLMSPAKADSLDIPSLDPSGMPDELAAAYCWLMHMAYYEKAAAQAGPSAIRSLNCERLLEQPVLTLEAVADFWEQTTDHQAFATALQDNRLKYHAKIPGQPFSAERRRTDLQTHAFQFRKEIKRANQWMDSLGLREELPGSASLPLMI